MNVDCQESVETEHPAEWESIKELCDDNDGCLITYTGVAMQTCTPGNTADYLQIFYDCLPLDVTGPVGFTVKVPIGYNTVENEVVAFTQVLSNFGGHFNPNISSFMCPYDGVYMFSMTIATFNSYVRVWLFRNTEFLAAANPDDNYSGANDFEFHSPTIVVGCSAGDVIWAEAQNYGYIESYDDATLLTGALLYRF